MALFRILFASVCILTFLDLGLASSVNLKESNVNSEMSENVRSIVQAAYDNHSSLERKVQYVAYRMNESYYNCTWNVVANADDYKISSDYWILLSGRHYLMVLTDFLIFSGQCNGKY
ncbi:hypothetical protein Trydic_g6742 [Trypoxylus dichotomus]